MAQKYPTTAIAAELLRGVPATLVKAHYLGISLRLKPKQGSRLGPGLDPDPSGIDLTD